MVIMWTFLLRVYTHVIAHDFQLDGLKLMRKQRSHDAKFPLKRSRAMTRVINVETIRHTPKHAPGKL